MLPSKAHVIIVQTTVLLSSLENHQTADCGQNYSQLNRMAADASHSVGLAKEHGGTGTEWLNEITSFGLLAEWIRYNELSDSVFLEIIEKSILMVSTKAEVLRRLEENRTRLSEFGVRRISLFGSFLYNQATDESDIDLLVEFRMDQKTFTNFSNLVYFLETLLGRRVEIVTTESLSPYIGPYILREAEHVTTDS